MKEVTVIVPDIMIHTWRGSRHSGSKEVPVNEETFLYALVTDDYHINWYFRDPKSIRIVSIKDENSTKSE